MPQNLIKFSTLTPSPTPVRRCQYNRLPSTTAILVVFGQLAGLPIAQAPTEALWDTLEIMESIGKLCLWRQLGTLRLCTPLNLRDLAKSMLLVVPKRCFFQKMVAALGLTKVLVQRRFAAHTMTRLTTKCTWQVEAPATRCMVAMMCRVMVL